jgi:hypothetical protein
LTINQIVILIDRLKIFKNSEFDNHNSKKAEILTLITGFNTQNLRASLGSLIKKGKEKSDSFKEDLNIINDVLKNLK